MNLAKYDDIRLSGYYPQVTREGELIEDSPAFIERQERREMRFLYLGFVTLICVMLFMIYLIESRREFLLATYVIDYQERKEIRKERKEVFNFRKYIGMEK